MRIPTVLRDDSGPQYWHHHAVCPRIPLELLRPIVELVDDHADLIRLASVCTALRAETERLIYRNLDLDLETFNGRKFCANIPSIIQRVSKHVRRCVIHLPEQSRATAALSQRDPLYGLSSPIATSPRSFSWPWLAFGHYPRHSMTRLVTETVSCIAQMRELRELQVSGDLAGFKFGQPLRDARLPNLTHFTSTSSLDKATIAFLERQPHIAELTALHSRLSASSASITLSRKALPYLRSIHTLTPTLAASLVPRRPVSRVEISVWNCENIRSVAAALATSSSALRALLVIQGFRLEASDLAELAMYLPDLEFIGECNFRGSLDACIQKLSDFRKLRTAVVAVPYTSSATGWRDKQEVMEPHLLLEKLTTACPSLNTIVMTTALTPRFYYTRESSSHKWRCVGDRAQSVCLSLWAET